MGINCSERQDDSRSHGRSSVEFVEDFRADARRGSSVRRLRKNTSVNLREIVRIFLNRQSRKNSRDLT